MKKLLFHIIFAIFFAGDLSAQLVVSIPNANFKSALLKYTKINTNNDKEIQVSEAIAYSDSIDVSSKTITNLIGIEAFVNIKKLYCSSNQLNSLNVSKNIALISLHCGGNKLTQIDVSENTALTSLDCSANLIIAIDVSKNIALTSLYCGANKLTTLYVKNGTNGKLKTFDATTNPLLKCIQVDDPNKIGSEWKKDVDAIYSVDCGIIYIPGVTFKEFLLKNQQININGDKEIQVSEAVAYSGAIDVPIIGSFINLTGIEAFVNIQRLYVEQNQLKTLDVSKNTALTELYCGGNQLTSLDFSKNTALTKLYCTSNQLTSLDVSKNTALTFLECYSNSLKTLDFSKNTALTLLHCSRNQLTTLDLSKNTALTKLYCTSNQLTSLDVSKNTALNELYCYSNQLTSLDVSKNTALNELYCFENRLRNLNLKNGANTKLDFLDARNNILLKCIQADNPNKVDSNWKKDDNAVYSLNCTVANEDAAIVQSLMLYPNPATNTVHLRWEADITLLQVDLLNSVGALVKSQNIDNQGNINVADLPRGLYLCRLSDANHKIQTATIVLE